jgi:hypothetical protein
VHARLNCSPDATEGRVTMWSRGAIHQSVGTHVQAHEMDGTPATGTVREARLKVPRETFWSKGLT